MTVPEPTTNLNAWAKILLALHTLPLWVLSGLAISSTILLYFSIVPLNWILCVKCFSILFWTLFICKSTSQLINHFFPQNLFSPPKLHITATKNCHWSTATQADGSVVTQISTIFLAKNLTANPMRPLRIRLVKPKIPGKILDELLSIQSSKNSLFGDPKSPGYDIPPKMTRQVSSTIHIQGIPKNNISDIQGIIAILDDEGKEYKIKTLLKKIPS